MSSKPNIAGNILLTLAFVFLPQFASAQSNTFPASGNVGVGTMSPMTDLEVKNSSRVGVTVNSSANSTDASIVFQRGGVNKWFLQSRNSGAPTDSFGIYDAVNYTFPFMVTRSGNVGIGTTTPASILSVNLNNSDYTNTGGAGSHLVMTNPNTTGQNVVSSIINGSIVAKWRTDYAGNMSWVAGPSGKHDFYTGSDFPSGTVRMTILNNGNVGIGTSTPDNPLTVRASGSSTQGFAVKNNALTHYLSYIGPRGSGGTAQNQSLVAVVDQGTSTVVLDAAGPSYFTGGNVGIGNTSPTEKLHVTGNGKLTGNLTVDGNINAKYQDLAEWVLSSEELSAGTVVILDPTKSNQVVSSITAYDTRVAGVISAQPGITLGEGGEGKVLVATTGRVRVKVDASRGAIQIGDLLVTSDDPGVAMKSEAVEFAGRKMHMPGTIIGKALEPMAKGSGEILVLLSFQ